MCTYTFTLLLALPFPPAHSGTQAGNVLGFKNCFFGRGCFDSGAMALFQSYSILVAACPDSTDSDPLGLLLPDLSLLGPEKAHFKLFTLMSIRATSAALATLKKGSGGDVMEVQPAASTQHGLRDVPTNYSI